jgi:simple sugar transport system permease protein
MAFRRHTHEILLAVFLALLVFAVGAVDPSFLGQANLFDLLKSSVVTGIFALGVLVVLVSGGIDISFTAVGAFGMYAATKLLLLLAPSASVVWAFLLAGSVGSCLGLVNAVFISYFRLPTLIVTLGTLGAFRGALLAFVGTAVLTELPGGMLGFSKLLFFERLDPEAGRIGLAPSVFVFAALVVVTWVLLRFTLLGRGIYALGGNPVAAERAGFSVTGIRIVLYGFVGFLAGVAGVVHACHMRNADPFDLVGRELGVIAAVVLGGASITGGYGTVAGTVLGVLVFVVIEASLIPLGVPSEWQRVVTGIVVIAGAAITVWARGRRTEGTAPAPGGPS